MKNTAFPIRLGAVVAATLFVAGCGGGGGESSQQTAMSPQGVLPPFNFEIKTLSNRADLISDGNALIEVKAPKTVPMDKVKLLLNDVDVTAGFVADPAARTFRGVLTGLAVGANTFIADSNGNGTEGPGPVSPSSTRSAGVRYCSLRRPGRGSARRRRRSPHRETRRRPTPAA